VPDPADYATWVDLVQSPDVLAVEYNVPLWSDRHFELIAKSMKLLGESGNRNLYIPLIAHTNLGNEESMVRWVPKGEGTYEFDFTAMDKYLDLAIQTMGQPKIVVLQVWDLYMSSRESAGVRFREGIEKSGLQFQGGPKVTVVDPAAGGKPQIDTLPKLADPSSKPLWRGLILQVREHMRKRNLDKSLMFGMFTDACPTKEDLLFFKELAPDLPWVQQGHGLYDEKQKAQGVADLGYQATVWGAKFCDSVPTHGTTDTQDLHGWRGKQLAADFERNTELDNYPGTRWRQFAEQCITGNMRGVYL
jgi:hypothetical protein